MAAERVLVIEAGLGNLGSVGASLDRLGVSYSRIAAPPPLNQVDVGFTHLMLPGVGSFQAGMAALQRLGWHDWIRQTWLPTGRPLLGICLGMQLLASSGLEGSVDGEPVMGLDLIAGAVRPLAVGGDLVLPHVGWNAVHWQDPGLPLATGFPQGGDVYFVHSFAFYPAQPELALASCDYGGSFTAVVGDARRNVWGMQFHPEKSQKLGRRLLENFLALGPCSNAA
ncbi:MAG: imidazole glycerol phosphate synthase subunit HisH [Cyanobacteria bacterium K_DeepCast_35m_m2_023]|nr:imidazole glycerol phosphate synthase subunit HisH [Cyanobacteria bacterium K_DeepCast_35m_m2_023]